VIPPTRHFGLPVDRVTLADRLRAAGYATGLFGKWHLGNKDRAQHPLSRGFDEFFGFLAGGHSYLGATADGDADNPILDGFEPVTDIGYTTDAFAARAVSFIERHRDQPFFVYLSFNAVHLPLEATQPYLDRFPGIQNEPRRTFAAMLSALDDGVGVVVEKLRDLGIEDDTLIFYLSDNGGPTPKTTSSNAPFRGFKRDVLEGGIRVPFIVQWKSGLPAGHVDSRPVISLDIHTTALAAAGISSAAGEPPLDGVDLLPFLRGEREGQPHQALFWRYGAQTAIRQGDWKLCRGRDGRRCLYDLASDPEEARDLSEQAPEKVRELQRVYDGWNAELIPSLWEDRHADRRSEARATAQERP
jgi:arylsulfatase A-like enzyme